MQIISRAQWGARPMRDCVKGDAVTETFLHHTVGYGSGGAAYMRQMQDQHMAPGWAGTKNGGCDIAYNFVIDPKTLTVYEGRGWGVRPGAQKSYNKGTWAVCIMGHFSIWKPAQFPGLLELITELIAFGHSLGRIPRVLTGGHRDAPGATTTCPGNNLYPAIPLIRQLLEDDMPLSDDDVARVARAVANLKIKRGSDPALYPTWIQETADIKSLLLAGGGDVSDADLEAAVNHLIEVLPSKTLAALKAKL